VWPGKIIGQQKQRPEEGIPEGGSIPTHRDTTINRYLGELVHTLFGEQHATTLNHQQKWYIDIDVDINRYLGELLHVLFGKQHAAALDHQQKLYIDIDIDIDRYLGELLHVLFGEQHAAALDHQQRSADASRVGSDVEALVSRVELYADEFAQHAYGRAELK